MTTAARPVRLGPRASAALALVSLTGVAAFGWPLLASAQTSVDHAAEAPWLFALLLPLLLAVLMGVLFDGRAAEDAGTAADRSTGAALPAAAGVDAKSIAMLGVLAAVGAALRPLGAGTAGLEPMFFLLIVASRVLGPGFGFVLGATTMFASALLTGGVGPWLPFQMLSMGWVCLGAGLLPGAERLRGRAEVWLLASYGVIAAFAYGLIMNFQGWPLTTRGLPSDLAFVPGGAVGENLGRFLAYCLATSMGWDLGRALTTFACTLVVGAPVLKALRRATRRAAFGTPVRFE
ncbi:ECF transporter S component [Streptomyces polyrhachis]|uniref:ECF transporter S component n=1 Tax=Streptomyces polyrhachis TaxID=1282885 RepID=A0ABW2GKX8_9ACTN